MIKLLSTILLGIAVSGIANAQPPKPIDPIPSSKEKVGVLKMEVKHNQVVVF